VNTLYTMNALYRTNSSYWHFSKLFMFARYIDNFEMNDNPVEAKMRLKRFLLMVMGTPWSFPDEKTVPFSRKSEQEINGSNGHHQFLKDSSLHHAQLTSIAGIVSELLGTGMTISLRDVYYSLKHIFKSQAECNNVIIELGSILRLKRCKGSLVLKYIRPPKKKHLSLIFTLQSVLGEMGIIPTTKGIGFSSSLLSGRSFLRNCLP
jgi:Type IIB DNA topoisomerase